MLRRVAASRLGLFRSASAIRISQFPLGRKDNTYSSLSQTFRGKSEGNVTSDCVKRFKNRDFSLVYRVLPGYKIQKLHYRSREGEG